MAGHKKEINKPTAKAAPNKHAESPEVQSEKLKLKSFSHELAESLKPNAKKAWHSMTDEQRKAAHDLCAMNTSYHKRVTDHLNSPKFKVDIIEKGGRLKGLTSEGIQAWAILPADLQFDIFLTSADGTAPNVVKFLNECWEGYHNGIIDEGTLLQTVQTLSSEVEEKRMVQ